MTVISSLIDLKLDICVCCNNTECSVKKPYQPHTVYELFPLEIFTALSACLEYNFVIYSLNIFKFDMHECLKNMECIAQEPELPNTNFELFPYLTFIFIAFLACPEQNFIILRRNDLKVGILICCNFWKWSA